MTTIENGQPLSTHSSSEIQTEEDQSRWYRQRTAADRILKCDQSDYSQILGLTEPIIKKDAYRAWDKLSDLLSPEGNPSDTQYVLAQKAHDWLWTAAKFHGVCMSDYWGNDKSPPVFCKVSEPDLVSSYDFSERWTNLEFDPLGPDFHDFTKNKMERIMDKILDCDPTDYEEILDMKHKAIDQVILDCHFLARSAWISPFINPSKDGDVFERQKKAFNVLYDAGEGLGVSGTTLEEMTTKYVKDNDYLELV
ncbi:MAG: hypothetical protein Q9161_009831 [Pseudevernia consocians]